MLPPDVLEVLAFARDSLTMLTATVSGLSGVLQAPVYDRLLAEIASMALLAVIVVGAVLRWRRLRPTFWAAVAGLVTLLAATRISPGGQLQMPDSPRYLYPETLLFLWILVELAAAWRDAEPPGPEPWSPAWRRGCCARSVVERRQAR